VDLTRTDAERALVQGMQAAEVDALFHLAFLFARVRDPAFAHELEVMGTLRVLAAASEARVPRLIVPSLTALYGPSPQNPALLEESAPLRGCPGSRFIEDKREVERELRVFAARHPRAHLVVLRFAPLLGPGLDNPLTRLLRRKVVPTLMGFDPLWQALHELDAGAALHLALHTRATGTFNIVGRGLVPFSELVQSAGARPFPLPGLVAQGTLSALHQLGAVAVPLPLLDYLRYSCVAEGSRAESELGFRPHFHTREAAASLGGGRHGEASAGQ
jgi:UDP-glucose 4-epimerase